MGKMSVTFDIEKSEATDKEILDWLKFVLGATEGIELSNPLAATELESEYVKFSY